MINTPEQMLHGTPSVWILCHTKEHFEFEPIFFFFFKERRRKLQVELLTICLESGSDCCCSECLLRETERAMEAGEAGR